MTTRLRARLTSLSGALRNDGYSNPPSHREMRERAIAGDFPAHQVNFIWHYWHDDLPVIVEALGLTRAPDAPDVVAKRREAAVRQSIAA